MLIERGWRILKENFAAVFQAQQLQQLHQAVEQVSISTIVAIVVSLLTLEGMALAKYDMYRVLTS